MKSARFLLVLAIVLMAGCSHGKREVADNGVSGSTPTEGHLSSKAIQISIIVPAQPTEMTDAIKSGADSAAQTLESNDGLKIVTKWRPYKSQSELQDALQASVLNHDQAMMLRPDPAISIDTQLRQASAAGIKVVTMGVDVKKNQREVFCGIPDEKLGNRLGYTIATRKSLSGNVGVIYDSGDADALKGLREVAAHYKSMTLTDFPLKAVDIKGVLALIHGHPEHKSWVVFKSAVLADPEDLKGLDPKNVEIFTLGCWPRQLPLLESGLLKPLSLPSYELGYLALCRAIDMVAYHRKTDDTYMIATPLVDSKSVRGYALTLRRWGFTDVASKYLDTVRSGDMVR